MIRASVGKLVVQYVSVYYIKVSVACRCWSHIKLSELRVSGPIPLTGSSKHRKRRRRHCKDLPRSYRNTVLSFLYISFGDARSSWVDEERSQHTVTFKVAFSTFWFKFGATIRRQAERSDSEARHKAPNLT